jgi:hypothetical protein
MFFRFFSLISKGELMKVARILVSLLIHDIEDFLWRRTIKYLLWYKKQRDEKTLINSLLNYFSKIECSHLAILPRIS